MLNLQAFIISLLIIGIGELGDKSQLLTFNFALKYPFRLVASAVIISTLLLQFIAVYFGHWISAFIDPIYLKMMAGALFVSFGIWEFIPELGKKTNHRNLILPPFLLISTTFMLAEIGDKTQLAAAALAMEYNNWLFVWLGASLGMIAVNLSAVFLAKIINDKLTKDVIKFITSVIFVIFGAYLLISAFTQTPAVLFSPK